MWGRQTVLISVAQSQLHQPRAAKEFDVTSVGFQRSPEQKPGESASNTGGQAWLSPSSEGTLKVGWLSWDWGSHVALMFQPGDPGGLFPAEGSLVLLLGGWGRAACAMLRPEMVSKPTLRLFHQLHLSGMSMGDPIPATRTT